MSEVKEGDKGMSLLSCGNATAARWILSYALEVRRVAPATATGSSLYARALVPEAGEARHKEGRPY